MATVARVESLRRHLHRDGTLLRPALVRVCFEGFEPFVVTLDADAARDLAARLMTQAQHAEVANRTPSGRELASRP